MMTQQSSTTNTFDARTATDWWRKFSADLDWSVSELKTLRLGTAEESKKAVIHPDLIPARRSGVDQAELDFHINSCKAAIPNLRSLIEKQSLSLEFIHAWAAFKYSEGYILACVLDLGRRPYGSIGGRPKSDTHRVWIAKLLRQEMDAGSSRPDAEVAVAKRIRNAIKDQRLQKGLTQEWLEVFLDVKWGLKGTYTNKNMSNAELNAFAALTTDVPLLCLG